MGIRDRVSTQSTGELHVDRPAGRCAASASNWGSYSVHAHTWVPVKDAPKMSMSGELVRPPSTSAASLEHLACLQPPLQDSSLKPPAGIGPMAGAKSCLLYTSDAADEEDSVDLGGRRIIKKKKKVIDTTVGAKKMK
eukprot:TRINITY_DN13320_c0_g1_i2.p1 TRINITY_DN13320_c0_g1~~TRINITY_DN13320_c0_g1_i2.p1  ORF type:complete len:137 (+),score=18.19 TRINITY_DN13320_c0_g1_i2:96-506(+)